MKKNLFYLLVLLLTGYVFTSCSEDRTEVENPQNNYESLDDFYDENEVPEQSFTIDSTHADTITGMNGTKIWGLPKEIWMTKATHQDINYPYTLKLKEAYSIKNMILSKLPCQAQSKILQCNAELKITAFKNSDELMLKQNCFISLMSPSASPVTGMQVYYGFTNGTTNDWNSNVLSTDYIFTSDVSTSLVIVPAGYKIQQAKAGWINVAKLNTYTNLSNITFTADGTNTSMIDVFVVFNNLHSYIKVNNMAATELPTGEPVTIFALGKANGSMYYFKQNYSISNNMVIALQMQQATSAQVLDAMAGL